MICNISLPYLLSSEGIPSIPGDLFSLSTERYGAWGNVVVKALRC